MFLPVPFGWFLKAGRRQYHRLQPVEFDSNKAELLSKVVPLTATPQAKVFATKTGTPIIGTTGTKLAEPEDPARTLQ
jgi:hypothetical protein